ncbi:MAG: hypothetical protein A3I72_11050 [Candidatus Tectomicrobia bacterium RIFCSPLOWO2_02_FULL_70_19]|nr:MAG: hypothetical protein A3I72_11050 [Candidatus Tectomicrobia bacterium RIFCSPLOWO2_02_FULL_70_19]
MDWLTLSLVSALTQATRNAVMKSLGHQLDEYINVFGRFVFLLPFAAAATAWSGAPAIQPGFFWACFLFGLSQTAAALALSKALLYGDIGIVTSLQKLSVVWLVILSAFTLGEVPSPLGLAGIGVTLAGVYGLNVSRARVSFWEPVRTVFTDKGQGYTLLSSLMYAPSVVTFKWAAVTSSAPLATLGVYSAAALCILPVTLYCSARHFREIPRLWKSFFSLGLFAAISSLASAEAYRLVLSSYVESVKQTEILFAVAMGYLFFRERERLGEALLGGAVILAGLVLVILGG